MEVCDDTNFPIGITCTYVVSSGTTLVCTDCLEITCS